MPTYANICVATYTKSNRDFFTYEIPPALQGRLQAGQLVLVPFGPRQLRGVVFELTTDVGEGRLRPVTRVLSSEPLFAPWQLKLIRWMSAYYNASLYSCVQTVNPFAFKPPPKITGETVVGLADNDLNPDSLKLGPKQRALIELLRRRGEVAKTALVQEYNFGYPTIKKLVDQKLLTERMVQNIMTHSGGRSQPARPLALSRDQATAVQAIMDGLDAPPDNRFLLWGVTNSGKTEVYMQAIEAVLKRKQQAVLLVPEITLTPQTIDRLSARFPDQVAVWHSKLSHGERFRTYEQVKIGRIPVIVGSRSALFLPFPHIGLIILDEEHEISYKQEQNPRYQTRTAAAKIAELTGASLVFGSATPTVESFEAAERGELKRLDMPVPINVEHVTERPAATVVDLRHEFKRGNRSTISRPLQQEIQLNLENNEQTILFLNRRGRSTYVFCRECGHVAKCPECELPLTYHLPYPTQPMMLCHHCGFQTTPPSECPNCGGGNIRYLGAGTQKVMEDLKSLYPQARLLRVDADTTANKDSHREVYDRIADHAVDIVVGTQIMAKGWDLPKVSLVGVLLADQSLHFPDFRAGERTFQLIRQVTGRAGRGRLPARIVVQTYQTENEYIRLALEENPESFYRFELENRRMYDYPPFSQLVKLEKSFASEEEAIRLGQALVADLEGRKAEFPELEDIQVLGPMPAFIPKHHNQFHYQVILKGHDPGRMLYSIPDDWVVDVDPTDML